MENLTLGAMMDLVWYGPREGEGPPPRVGPVDRVAVLADIHGNIPALEAVLTDIHREHVDLIVFCGDLSWGPEPERTIEIARRLGTRALFARGNADRFVVELAHRTRQPERPRDVWMRGRHTPTSVQFLAEFPFNVLVEIRGLGMVRFCHGSPRSDTELITPNTSVRRLADIADLINERTLVSGHSHLQFDRQTSVLRSINPGSVGLPYHDGLPGTAYWALVGPDVQLRTTSYDARAAVTELHRSGDPAAQTIADLLLSPPSVRDVIEHAEGRVFSD